MASASEWGVLGIVSLISAYFVNVVANGFYAARNAQLLQGINEEYVVLSVKSGVYGLIAALLTVFGTAFLINASISLIKKKL